MSQICAVALCNRTSRALCHCCEQYVCIIHLSEHNDILNSRLNPLANTINTLHGRLQTTNIQKIVDDCRQKLEQWRAESYKKIDQFFEQKCQELNQLVAEKVDEQREEIRELEIKINTLIRQQQVTREDIYELTSAIEHVEEEINNLKEKFIEINTNPLMLDNNLITIRGINEEVYDLSILSSIYKTINRPDGSYGALASNDRYLLLHQAPNLCLIDQNLDITKKTRWRHEIIHDMCWSSTLDRFIIVSQKNIFLIDENTMSIEQIKTFEKRKWLSCTCSDKFLFLSTNEWCSSITKISLTSSKKFDKQWQSPDVCYIDEYIDVIAYNEGKLALIIRNNLNNIIRMELRSSETLDKVWAFPLDVIWNPNKPFHCCSFIGESWLVADYESGRLLHVTKTGKVKSIIPYNTIPYYVTRFGQNVLAISTKDGINFHNLNYKKTYTIFVL